MANHSLRLIIRRFFAFLVVVVAWCGVYALCHASKDSSSQQSGSLSVLWMIVATAFALTGLFWLWRIRSTLKQSAAYESLITEVPPGHPAHLEGVKGILLVGATTLVVAISLGVIASEILEIEIAAGVQWSVGQLLELIPLATVFVDGEISTTAKQQSLAQVLSVVYSLLYGGVLLFAAEGVLARTLKRRDVAGGLLLGSTISKCAPFGENDEGQTVPRERVLVDQAERMGAGLIDWMIVRIWWQELQNTPVSDNGKRAAATAFVHIIRSDKERVTQKYSEAAGLLFDWLMDPIDRIFISTSDFKPLNEETARLVADLIVPLATAISLDWPKLPNAQSALPSWPDRGKQLRKLIDSGFRTSPSAPPMLLTACCQAATELGGRGELLMIDRYVGQLHELQAFTIPQADEILQCRDAVLRQPWWQKDYLEPHLAKVKKAAGLEELMSSSKSGRRFRRETDGAEMILIDPGSFQRGRNHDRRCEPIRRVHLDAYLIDVEPVSQSSFQRWLDQTGAVQRMDRGFFPIRMTQPTNTVPQREMVHVSWFGARAYCLWASANCAGRLPTEGEWERLIQVLSSERNGFSAIKIIEWTEDAWSETAYQMPVVINPLTSPETPEADRSWRGVTNRNPQTLKDYHFADRRGGHPVTFSLEHPIGFRVVIPLSQAKEL